METNNQNDTSKWGVVEYRVDYSQPTNTDKIIIDNPYVAPIWYDNDLPPREEVTELEVQEYALINWLFHSNKNLKVITPNLNPEDIELRTSLGLIEDEVFYTRVINYNQYDAWHMLTNNYTSLLTDNPIEIFGANYHISDQQFAQLKAAKMRVEIARDYLLTHAPASEGLNAYREFDKYYKRIETIYNGYHNPDYMPNILIDDSSEGYTAVEHQAMVDRIKKLPLPLRQVLVDIRIISDENLETEHFLGVFGDAGSSREIRLNSSYDGLDGVLLHELGHIVDFMSAQRTFSGGFVSSLSRQEDFQHIWRTAFANDRPYTRDNVAEAFADGFAQWVSIKYFDASLEEMERDRPGAFAYFDRLGETLFAPNSLALQGGGRSYPPARLIAGSETETVTRVIRYIDPTGQELAEPVTETLTFTRTTSTNAVTGAVTYGEWTSAKPQFDTVSSPVLSGHTASKLVVDSEIVTASSSDQEVVVVYQTNQVVGSETATVTRVIRYVDPTGQGLAESVTEILTFTRTILTNAVTGDVTYGEWTSAKPQFDAVSSPVLSGRTTSKLVVDSEVVTATSPDQEIVVVYQANQIAGGEIHNRPVVIVSARKQPQRSSGATSMMSSYREKVFSKSIVPMPAILHANQGQDVQQPICQQPDVLESKMDTKTLPHTGEGLNPWSSVLGLVMLVFSLFTWKYEKSYSVKKRFQLTK